MEKRKFGTKILGLVFILTILSCYFLGSTFAKYTSSTEGTASATVAKWEITGITDQTNAYSFSVEKVAPSKDGSEKKISAGEYVITNKSDVDVEITITPAALTFYDYNNAAYTDTEENGLTATTIGEVFTLAYTWKKGDAAMTENKVTLAKGETLTITGAITWRASNNETEKDEVDTKIGMHVSKITGGFSLVAVQASDSPANN